MKAAKSRKIGRKNQPKYRYLDRATFVEQRYQSFLKKKAFLDKVDPERAVWHLTDLDYVYEKLGKPLKDVVICERCNEDIADDKFIMLEDSYCYHDACVQDDPWYVKRPALVTTAPAPLPEPEPEPEIAEPALPPNVILFRKPE